METLDGPEVTVIGGGVVGMAIARELARRGREVVLLEAEAGFGTHASSRNSEVIHAGIYYPQGSLKAQLCVSGKQLLYEYCDVHAVRHERIGKLIVATNQSQVAELQTIRARAVANGVNDLSWLDAGKVHDIEPSVVARAGLYSPSTGIVDSHEYLAHLRRDAVEAGAMLVTSSPVLGGFIDERGATLEVGGEEPSRMRCKFVINAAGLFAQDVARSIAGIPAHQIPPTYFAKGHYFTLARSSPFSHLIYPVPEPGGLGVHVTLDLARSVRFGPDVSWVDTVDYSFDESRIQAFRQAIRAYYPSLDDDDLNPGYTGIRAKIVPPGTPAADFLVQGPETHGLPLVNLFGIESPGLTASLALAALVGDRLTHTVGSPPSGGKESLEQQPLTRQARLYRRR